MACSHITTDYVVGNEKMKHLLTSLEFFRKQFIEENNEVAMRLDPRKRNRMTKKKPNQCIQTRQAL